MKQFIKKYFDHWLNLNDKIKFVLVGGYNSLFGYLTFCFLQILLMSKMHYLLILTIGHFISVLNSFLSFKFLVFHSKGNFLQEYLRVNLVYIGYLIANALLLFILKDIIGINIFISQLFCVITLAILVYFGHKYFSFKKWKKNYW